MVFWWFSSFILSSSASPIPITHGVLIEPLPLILALRVWWSRSVAYYEAYFQSSDFAQGTGRKTVQKELIVDCNAVRLGRAILVMEDTHPAVWGRGTQDKRDRRNIELELLEWWGQKFSCWKAGLAEWWGLEASERPVWWPLLILSRTVQTFSDLSRQSGESHKQSVWVRVTVYPKSLLTPQSKINGPGFCVVLFLLILKRWLAPSEEAASV